MDFVDADNPTHDEIRRWAAQPGAMFPTQDWDIIIAAEPRRDALFVELAADPDGPNAGCFLAILYLVVGDAVRTSWNTRSRAQTTRLMALGRRSSSPALHRWADRSEALIEAPSTFSYEEWCGGRIARRDASPKIRVTVVDGDLTNQPVEVIVNAWNRNIIPWWLLIPQGVSRAIRRAAGTAPFRELARRGAIPLGGAELTSAGRLPYKGIIHVAGISMGWRASPESIRRSVVSAIDVAIVHGFRSIAFPLIGAGTGGRKQAEVLDLMLDELHRCVFDGEVIVVTYRRRGT